MNIKNKNRALGLLWIGKFISIVPFIIGIILNFEGYDIISNASSYKPGLLVVDSFEDGMSSRGGTSALIGSGYVDSVRTGIFLAKAGTLEGRHLMEELQKNNRVEVSVWCRPDGKLTLKRYAHENEFSARKIWEKLITNVVLFNFPLVILWITDWRLKKKYAKIEPVKKSEEFY